jgi:hypothetical protein
MADKPEHTTQYIKAFMEWKGLKPLDLVRLCGIGVNSA